MRTHPEEMASDAVMASGVVADFASDECVQHEEKHGDEPQLAGLHHQIQCIL